MTVPSIQEALDYARKRNVVLPQDFYDPANEDQHGNLMTVSQLATLAQIQAVTDDLMKALDQGETFEQWQQRVQNIPGVGNLPPGRLETIFRNWMQTAYNGGRWLNFEQNKVAIPYLMFSAINDDRTTDICRHRNGMIRKVDDPFWATSSPPLHHRSILPDNRVCGKVYSALKARYAGPAIEVIGESGCRFTVTAQHPVLTDHGWVLSDQLTEGMNLVGYRGIIDGSATASDAHEDYPPPTIEQVFETMGRRGRVTMPRATLDLHGDEMFIQSDVDIVAADRRLMAGYQTFLTQQTQQFLLALADNAHRSFQNVSSFAMGVRRHLFPGFGFLTQLAFVIFTKIFNKRLSRVGDNSPCSECGRQGFGAHTELASDRLEGCSAFVEGKHLFWDVSLEIGARNPTSFCSGPLDTFLAGSPFDSRIVDVSTGSALTNPQAHSDVAKAHPGLIEQDRIIALRRFDYSGQVYDLHTKAGYIIIYNGGGLKFHPMISNCRSTLIPLTAGQAKNRSVGKTGLNQPNPPDTAAPGWGYKPDLTGMKKSFKDQFKERMSKAPSWLQKIIRKIFDWIS